MAKWWTALKQMQLALLRAGLRSMRASLVTGAALTLLGSLGVGKYLNSSLQAVDVRRAAALTPDTRKDARVLVIGIDDQAFQGFFDGQSPLRQDHLAELLETVAAHAGKARRIVVDIDLAPTRRLAHAQRLEQVLSAAGSRWVLVTADGATQADSSERAAWRERLCRQGVSFALPAVATEFGYVRMGHQYRGALADVAWRQQQQCLAPEAPTELRRMALSPHELAEGTTVPFSGDLGALAQMIDALEPEWVVIGGMWGKDDVFQTPFGDRFGVQVHAAGLAGHVRGEREAPYLLQTAFAWGVVSAMTMLAAGISMRLRRVARGGATELLPGHRFLDHGVRPLLLLLVVCACIAWVSWALGALWASSGYWIPSSSVVVITLVTVALSWNWGRDDIRRGAKDGGMAQEVDALLVTPLPLQAEWQSVKQCLPWRAQDSVLAPWAALSARRRWLEGGLSALALLVQFGLPLLSFGLLLKQQLS